MPNDVLLIKDLRAAVTLALDAFEREHGCEIAVDQDLYWHLPVEASFDLSHEPSEHTVGQVSDDIHEIRRAVGQQDADPAWHSLAHAIGVLRVLERAALP